MIFSYWHNASLIALLSSLANRLMIRVTDYFETQLRVPSIKRQPRNGGLHPDPVPPLRLENGVLADSLITPSLASRGKEMTDEQIVNWFAKLLDSVRLRYRKLQRYVR